MQYSLHKQPKPLLRYCGKQWINSAEKRISVLVLVGSHMKTYNTKTCLKNVQFDLTVLQFLVKKYLCANNVV